MINYDFLKKNLIKKFFKNKKKIKSEIYWRFWLTIISIIIHSLCGTKYSWLLNFGRNRYNGDFLNEQDFIFNYGDYQNNLEEKRIKNIIAFNSLAIVAVGFVPITNFLSAISANFSPATGSFFGSVVNNIYLTISWWRFKGKIPNAVTLFLWSFSTFLLIFLTLLFFQKINHYFSRESKIGVDNLNEKDEYQYSLHYFGKISRNDLGQTLFISEMLYKLLGDLLFFSIYAIFLLFKGRIKILRFIPFFLKWLSFTAFFSLFKFNLDYAFSNLNHFFQKIKKGRNFIVRAILNIANLFLSLSFYFIWIQLISFPQVSNQNPIFAPFLAIFKLAREFLEDKFPKIGYEKTIATLLLISLIINYTFLKKTTNWDFETTELKEENNQVT